MLKSRTGKIASAIHPEGESGGGWDVLDGRHSRSEVPQRSGWFPFSVGVSVSESEIEASCLGSAFMDDEEAGAAGLLKQLQDSVDAHPGDPSLHFDLGVYLWERGCEGYESDAKERAAEHFLISARLNPQNAAAFRYLGHYYGGTRDSQRAIKCYQRAVTLNSDDQEAGEALCNLLDEEGKESLEVAICREASEKSPRASWAFRRLGYLQVHQKKWSEAVPSLQSAIRGYPTCADLWEALGLAYQRLGMYTAAIKSYGRAIELEDDRVFARVESGNTFMMLGSFRKAIEQFEKALSISPQSLSANYGLASALYGLSKECINTGAFKWGASLLEDACNIMKMCTRLAGNLSSMWKLLADIQILYAICFPWIAEEPALQLDASDFDKSIFSWIETRKSAARSARFSYQKALHLTPWHANIYMDIAICSDLISSLPSSSSHYELTSWQLPEKMALGALLLECDNYELWVALGCLSDHDALKQHCLIRALQLDASLAGAWAHLGKLYRGFNKQLARQAFDIARSIDPSLSLPWAGMSADSLTGEVAPDEAFESCLRAVQILPLAEFQVGLTKLALLSGYSTSSQVLGAICQAVQRAPYYPESHNLKGLIFEARHDYQSAAASYRVARHAICRLSGALPQTCLTDVTVNLARSLCKAGNSVDAVRECNCLTKEGELDVEGLHIYAYSLWKLGSNELALSTAKNLAAKIPQMEKSMMAASVSFICRLVYDISGLETAINSIQKMPKHFFESANVSFVLSGINVLDENGRLNQIISMSRRFLTSHTEIAEMHHLIALSKLIKNSSKFGLGYSSGIQHLQKALHMYPNSYLLRQCLGHLLLLSNGWNDSHLSTRCCIISCPDFSCEGLKSAWEILGAGAIACYAVGNSTPKFSFPTCTDQCLSKTQAVQQLQKSLHQEPWNRKALFLLVLNLLQRAREEKFPPQLCASIRRLISIALSIKSYPEADKSGEYQRFLLVLCASEMSFVGGNQVECIKHVTEASEFLLPNNYLFFAHLQLSRAFALEGDMEKFQREFLRCLELGTDFPIGWISLKLMQLLYSAINDSSILDLSFDGCLKKKEGTHKMWAAVSALLEGLVSLQSSDFTSAEQLLERACCTMDSESCSLLCYAIACIHLAKQGNGQQFVSHAISSLRKVQKTAVVPLPIVSTLLAQTEGSLSPEKWEQKLGLEWFTWSPDMRPAELFFQMHLLAEHSKAGNTSASAVVSCQSPQKWVSRAIHTDPTSARYWKILQKYARPTAILQ
ncbi:hypothetical protein SAY87_021885 [Trapa incisa]|uniref:Rhodanese domain-containing protein n=1 Tax=Trapa incisa TaxID=236973 RepID=A0AAN7JU71_9MYRT|nr:hypothetical protein SAY87_021885 [Trapa incisa]